LGNFGIWLDISREISGFSDVVHPGRFPSWHILILWIRRGVQPPTTVIEVFNPSKPFLEMYPKFWTEFFHEITTRSCFLAQFSQMSGNVELLA